MTESSKDGMPQATNDQRGLHAPSRRFVMMGVSGAGKSLIGILFARALGVPFVEGDALHPPDNVARMAAGIALTDADRAGWLQDIADRLAQARTEHRGMVVACSALRARYRDVLRAGDPDVTFVHLTGRRDLIAERMTHRIGHFMPATLLASQLETLEPPLPNECAWTCDISGSPEDIIAALVARVHAEGRLHDID
jgi:gluconokinase